jgi:AraC family transcriptional regulator
LNAFLGRTLRARECHPLYVSENAYAAAARLPHHAHAQAFLCLTLDGAYVEHHRSGSVQYGPGSLSFHPSGSEHSVAIGASEVRCLNVSLPSAWFQRLAPHVTEPTGFVRAVGGPAVWLAERLAQEVRGWSSASPLTVESLALEILPLLFRSRTGAPDRLPPRWLGDVDEILRREYTCSLTVGALADRLGVHPVNLSRTWRRYRRSSIGDAVRQLRIDEARRRLAAGPEGLADLALDVGFADQAHFTRAFRRVTGTTPRAFRLRAART